MAKIGLTDKFISLVSTYDIKYLKTEQAPASNANRRILKDLVDIAENIGKSKNLNNILNIERTILYSELSRCTDTSVDKGRVTSLTNAIDDLDKAANGLELVNDKTNIKSQAK